MKVVPEYENLNSVSRPTLESMDTDLLTSSFPAIHSDSSRIWKVYVIASQSSIMIRTKLDMVVICPLNIANKNNIGIHREGEQEQKKRINETSHERDNIRQNHNENYAWCYLTGGLFAAT